MFLIKTNSCRSASRIILEPIPNQTNTNPSVILCDLNKMASFQIVFMIHTVCYTVCMLDNSQLSSNRPTLSVAIIKNLKDDNYNLILQYK